METIEKLKELTGCGHAWAEQRARTALQLVEFKAQGEISLEEYQELMQDLIRTDQLDAEATEMEIKAVLVACVSTLARLI
jgi:polyhydroxyalkanoate synthesis regulator phasin